MGSFVSSSVPCDAVLWDLDGTLIDTSSASMETLRELVLELGGELELSTLVPIVEQQSAINTGKKATNAGKEAWALEVLRVTSLEAKLSPAALVKKWDERMVKKRADIQLMPGAMEVRACESRSDELSRCVYGSLLTPQSFLAPRFTRLCRIFTSLEYHRP